LYKLGKKNFSDLQGLSFKPNQAKVFIRIESLQATGYLKVWRYQDSILKQRYAKSQFYQLNYIPFLNTLVGKKINSWQILFDY
jgi:hypothetical protein